MHIRLVGFYCAAGALACVGLAAASDSRIGWWAATLTGALAIAAAAWSGSRGSLAAIVAGALVGAALLPHCARAARAASAGVQL